MKKNAGLAIALAVLLCTTVVSATDITVGTYQAGNCYPFMCNDSGTSSGQSIDYQQVYASSAFSGTSTINSLTFYYDSASGGSATVLSGTYDVYLSTTSAAVNGLSTTLANNRGADYTLVDSFNGGFSDNPSFTINLATPFLYNSANGNLLLEVIVNGQANVSNGSGNGYNQADYSGSTTTRAYYRTGSFDATADSAGLVTTFGFGTSSVPEPASLALLATGLLGLAWRKLRR